MVSYQRQLHSWRACLGVLLGLFILGFAQAGMASELPYYDTPAFTPRWLQADNQELERFHRIADFSFSNQDGETVTEDVVENKIYVASFFFSTCPGICPAIRSKLSKVQEHYLDDHDVLILSHSIRPTTDTPKILRAYADSNGVQSGKWHLLTGDKDALYRIAKDSYFASEDLGEAENLSDFLHTENLLLIDQDRRIRGIYNGLSVSSVNYLIADIGLLKAQSKASD